MDRSDGASTTADGAHAVPPSAPVPVAGAVVPVDFMVVMKRLGGGGGGDMAVHDASGGLAFRVADADGGGRRALLDAAGGALVTVRTSEGVWQAFRGISSELRHIIFTAKVISVSSNRKEIHVFFPPSSTFEDTKPSYRLIGNPFRRACTIIKGNSIVAQTNLLYKLKKVIYSRRKFRVTIYPGNDNILMMAMVMTFLVRK